jgi:Zinc knuckle
MQQDQSAKYMKQQGLDFEAICIEFGDFYQTACDAEPCRPSKNVKDSMAPPTNFGGLASKKALNVVQNQGTCTANYTRDVSGDKCNNCGQLGHWARNCPNKGNGGKNGNSPKAQLQHSPLKSWNRTPPAAGAQQTKTVQVKTYNWCKKCNCWTTLHGTEQHCAKGDGTSTPSKVNLPLVKNFAT